jgi:hypothetical protein
MHHNPRVERQGNPCWQEVDQIGVAPSNPDLADAYSKARSQSCQMRKMAVCAQGKILATKFEALLAQRAQRRLVLIETD